MTTKRKPRPFEKQALDLFKQAKELLQTNKAFTATVFLLYRGNVDVFEVPFQNSQEKWANFTHLVAKAVRVNADAIISITDQYYKKLPSKRATEQFLRRYRHGDIEAENAPEELGMIISPRNGPDWGLAIPYTRTPDTGVIVYGRARSNTRAPYTNSLVPESWKTAAKAKAAKRNAPSSAGK